MDKCNLAMHLRFYLRMPSTDKMKKQVDDDLAAHGAAAAAAAAAEGAGGRFRGAGGAAHQSIPCVACIVGCGLSPAAGGSYLLEPAFSPEQAAALAWSDGCLIDDCVDLLVALAWRTAVQVDAQQAA
jgi:hypothetical protein